MNEKIFQDRDMSGTGVISNVLVILPQGSYTDGAYCFFSNDED